MDTIFINNSIAKEKASVNPLSENFKDKKRVSTLLATHGLQLPARLSTTNVTTMIADNSENVNPLSENSSERIKKVKERAVLASKNKKALTLKSARITKNKQHISLTDNASALPSTSKTGKSMNTV